MLSRFWEMLDGSLRDQQIPTYASYALGTPKRSRILMLSTSTAVAIATRWGL